MDASESSAADDDPGSTSGDPQTDTTDAQGRCGDGLQGEGEACDDGNDENADGCSVACERSGTIVWSHALPEGFAVGLSSREGDVVAATQRFSGETFEPAIAVDGFDGTGTSLGSFVDPGGLSDLTLAQAPVELLPEGTVALAYHVAQAPPSPDADRVFGILDFDRGVVGRFHAPDHGWGTGFGVVTGGNDVLVLHSESLSGDYELLLERFDTAANHLETISIGTTTTQHRPAFRGGILRRSAPMSVVLTTTENGRVDLWTHLLGPSAGYSVELGQVAADARAAAFSDGGAAWIWTGAELLQTDQQDHLIDTQSRSFEGELLWADAYGLVVGSDDMLVLYDAAGNERVEVALPDDGLLPMGARFVRPDEHGAGLFVLVDNGVSPKLDPRASHVALHYVVR